MRHGWSWRWGWRRVVPVLERHAIGSRRRLLWSLPGLLGLVLVVAGSRARGGLDQGAARGRASLAARRFAQRAPDRDGHGAGRPSEPLRLPSSHHPQRWNSLAKRGIRFDKVRATAPWTLPSHASMFTGRWPHELGVEWMTPLRGKFPTLAEYLGSQGYATAGFAANTLLLLVRHRHRPGLHSLRGL